jgi:23S rRNA pseudouridine955/2504/2580 synthase
MAALGTPILGDGKYGGRAAFLPGAELPRQLHLHAHSIAMPGHRTVTAPMPAHLRETLKALGLEP